MRSFSPFVTLLALAACTPDPTTDGDTDVIIPNTKPIADAGDASSQTADTPVPLTGAGSSDPDGDAITWFWAFDHVPDGSGLLSREAAFSVNGTAAAMNTTFTPDAVGTYVVKLVVTDAKGKASDPDYVIINVEDPETVPVANAGADIVTDAGTLASLDGSASYDPQGRTLSYAWSVVDKPTASTLTTMTGSDTPTSTFTPDIKGVYVLNLVVSNGLARSVSDAVTVTALGDDNAPVANAGPDQPDAEDCTTLQLDGSASADPDGDRLTYLWEVQVSPPGSTITTSSFSDRTAARPTFYPDVAGEYVVSVAVSDGTSWSTPDTLTLTASDRRSNERPNVNAGADTTVDGGSAVCVESGYVYACDECTAQVVPLGAGASVSDADGDPLVYLWTTTSRDATIADASSMVTTVTLEDAEPTEPGECEETEYGFELTVTDCTGATVSESLTLSVSCCGVEDTSAR